MSDKCYKKPRKYYLPSKSTLKTYPKKRKKPHKWINVDSSLKSTKLEDISLYTYDSSHSKIDCNTICSQESENQLQLSPILKYSSFREKSPVIGGKTTVVSIMDTKELIEDTYSSESEKEALNTIEQFLSQNCLELTPIQKDVVSVNVEPRRKRKKPFNKNGLAHHLHMALLRQNADVSFWKHEQEFAHNVMSDDSETLLVQITNCSKEFGISVLECVNLNKDENCLVILGSATSLVLSNNLYGQIKIYQPYITKTIQYKDNSMPCYLNVSKIVFV